MRRARSLSLGVVLLLAAPPARAALGGAEASIEADRAALSAVRRAGSQTPLYRVEVLEAPGATVREYVAPSGTVFALAWNGVARPDMATLLGDHAAEYQAALRASPRQPGRRPRRIETARIVVEHWGHMRNLQGRAWAPALLPPGVSADAIR